LLKNTFEAWKHKINTWLSGNNRQLVKKLRNSLPNTVSELQMAASSKCGSIECEV